MQLFFVSAGVGSAHGTFPLSGVVGGAAQEPQYRRLPYSICPLKRWQHLYYLLPIATSSGERMLGQKRRSRFSGSSWLKERTKERACVSLDVYQWSVHKV